MVLICTEHNRIPRSLSFVSTVIVICLCFGCNTRKNDNSSSQVIREHHAADFLLTRAFREYDGPVRYKRCDDRNAIVSDLEKCSGEAVQATRFLCWIQDGISESRSALMRQWLGELNAKGRLPDVAELIDRIRPLIAFDLNDQIRQREDEIRRIHSSVRRQFVLQSFFGRPLETSLESYPAKTLVPLFDDKEIGGLALLSKHESVIKKALKQYRVQRGLDRDTILKSHEKDWDLSGNVDYAVEQEMGQNMDMVFWAIEKMERGMNEFYHTRDDYREGTNPSVRYNAAVERYVHTGFFNRAMELMQYIPCDPEMNLPRNDLESLKTYLRYLKGNDVQLVRLLLYATSPYPRVREECMYQLLICDVESLTYEKLVRLFSFTLFSWTDNEKKERLDELRLICKDLKNERQRREKDEYNEDDGQGCWGLREISQHDVLSKNGLFFMDPKERMELYRSVLKDEIRGNDEVTENKVYEPPFMTRVWAMLWALEPDETIRNYIQDRRPHIDDYEGSWGDFFKSRMNETERLKRTRQPVHQTN